MPFLEKVIRVANRLGLRARIVRYRVIYHQLHGMTIEVYRYEDRTSVSVHSPMYYSMPLISISMKISNYTTGLDRLNLNSINTRIRLYQKRRCPNNIANHQWACYRWTRMLFNLNYPKLARWWRTWVLLFSVCTLCDGFVICHVRCSPNGICQIFVSSLSEMFGVFLLGSDHSCQYLSIEWAVPQIRKPE